MDNSVQNKIETKNRIINFLNVNKSRIYLLIFILLITLGSFIFFKVNNEKKILQLLKNILKQIFFYLLIKKILRLHFMKKSY